MNTRTDQSPSYGVNIWPLAAGASTVIVGLIFLAENLLTTDLDNLWALGLLPLAVGAVYEVWQRRQATGRITATMIAGLLFGVTMALAVSMSLFSLNMGEMWPIFLIAGGGTAMLAGWGGR